jgi:hypothetical protein
MHFGPNDTRAKRVSSKDVAFAPAVPEGSVIQMQPNPTLGRRLAKDKLATSGLMLARLGFVVTLLIGLALYVDLTTSKMAQHLHMTTGLLFLVGNLLAVSRYAKAGAGRGQLFGAALLTLVGMGLGLSLMNGALFPGVNLVHPLLMLAGTALLEMGAAKAKRA